MRACFSCGFFLFFCFPFLRGVQEIRGYSSESCSISASLLSPFLRQSGPFDFLNHTSESSGVKERKRNTMPALKCHLLFVWIFFPVCCSWYVWLFFFVLLFFLIFNPAFPLCSVAVGPCWRGKGGLPVMLGWPGHHSRFHGLSGSNGLSGAEGFTENQRHIETDERRNRWADGRCRRQEKEIDSDLSD